MSPHESAYKKFKETMVRLEQQRVQIVRQVIEKIDSERMTKLRKKIESRKKS